jgi:hypothetical protein
MFSLTINQNKNKSCVIVVVSLKLPKVEARDVRLSKMISVCVIGVPILWVVYAVLMLLFGFSLKHIGLYLFWCPFFSYLAVIATEAGMVDLKDLKPLLLRLMVKYTLLKLLMLHMFDYLYVFMLPFSSFFSK